MPLAKRLHGLWRASCSRFIFYLRQLPLNYATNRDRRQKRRQFRALWIARINAGARECGLSYSKLIDGLKKAAIEVDRKVLADLAMNDSVAFAAVAEQAKAALAK